jgi:hypothetical protein
MSFLDRIGREVSKLGTSIASGVGGFVSDAFSQIGASFADTGPTKVTGGVASRIGGIIGDIGEQALGGVIGGFIPTPAPAPYRIPGTDIPTVLPGIVPEYDQPALRAPISEYNLGALMQGYDTPTRAGGTGLPAGSQGAEMQLYLQADPYRGATAYPGGATYQPASGLGALGQLGISVLGTGLERVLEGFAEGAVTEGTARAQEAGRSMVQRLPGGARAPGMGGEGIMANGLAPYQGPQVLPFGGRLFKPTMSGIRAQSIVMVRHPVTNEPVFFRHVGKPVLFSGDFATARRVDKIARRARKATRRGR